MTKSQLSWSLTGTLLALLTGALAFAEAPSTKLPAGYRIETIAPPTSAPFEVEALAFAPDGSLYVSTRQGDIWHLEQPTGERRWTRFAHGLQEPLGLLVESTRQGIAVMVSQTTELTRLTDENGDGKADTYSRVGAGWGFSGNYSEYTHGLVKDARGSYFVALNLSVGGPGAVQDSTMARNVAYRGWVAEIRSDGTFVPFASGLRSPCGIGMDAAGEIFVTDNQGDWMPTSGLFHIEKGRFYGHPASLADWPEYKGRNLNEVPTEEFNRIRTAPAIWIPYGELANSPGQPTFNYTQGKFGPFDSQIFIGDQTQSNLFRAVIERVEGEFQGAVFDFAQGFKSGLIRGEFGPDGSYWAGQIDHGWASNAGQPGALERVVWDGKTVPFEIKSIRLTPTGFRLEFTQPVDVATAAQVTSYDLSHWHYLYQARYYSPKLEETDLAASKSTVSIDRMSVNLELPLAVNRVYRIRAKLNGSRGEPLTNNTGWYTVNRLLPPSPQ